MAIDFDIRTNFTGNNSDFIQTVKEMQSSVQHMSDVLREVGHHFDISSVKSQIISLTTVIDAAEKEIDESKKRISQWGKEAEAAFAAGDIGTGDSLMESISAENAKMKETQQGIEEMKKALQEIFSFQMNWSNTEKPMLFNSQEEYDHVQKLKGEIADLHAQILAASEDEDVSGLNKQLDKLEDNLRKSEEAAASNAAELGKNGEAAANASTKFYELTHKMREQEAKVISLTVALRHEQGLLKASKELGDTEGVEKYTESVDKIKNALHDARTELINLQGQQKSLGTQLNKLATEDIDPIVAGGNKVIDVLKRVAALAGVTFGMNMVKSFANKVMEVREYFQDIESSMKVFLGNEEKAAKFTKELKDYAYFNMFEFSDLAKASQQMIAYGQDVDSIIPRLDQLSNIAQGTHAPLMELVDAYNRAKSTGVVDARGIQSWAVKGVMIRDTLKEMGEMAVGTSVTFDQLNKVIEHVTGEGGMFHNLMGEMMENISAEKGQLADNLDSMFNEIGEKYQEVITKGYKLAGNVVDNYQELIGGVLDAGVGVAGDVVDWLTEHYLQLANVIKDAIIAFGTYKAALLAVNGVMKLQGIIASASSVATKVNSKATDADTAAKGRCTVATVLLRRAQIALNKAMRDNPYVLAASLIAGLAFGIYKLVTAETAAEKSVRMANEALEKQSDLLKERKNNINDLISIIKDENQTEYAKEQAYRKLAAIAPELTAAYTRQELAEQSLGETQKMLNENLAENEYKNAKKNVEEYTAKINDLKKRLDEFSGESMSYTGGQIVRGLKKELKDATEQLQVYKDNLKSVEEARNKVLAEEAENAKPMEVKVKEADENYKTKKSLLDFFDNMQNRLEELNDDKMTPFKNMDVSFDEAEKSVETFIHETENDMADLRKKIKDNPNDVTLTIELSEKQKLLDSLLNFKKELQEKGATNLPFVVDVWYRNAQQGEEDARNANRKGMHFVENQLGNEEHNGTRGFWELDKPVETRTPQQWKAYYKKEMDTADKALKEFMSSHKSITAEEDKAELDRLQADLKAKTDSYKAFGGDVKSDAKGQKEALKRRATEKVEEWKHAEEMAKLKTEGVYAQEEAKIAAEDVAWKREEMQRELNYKKAEGSLKTQEEAIYKTIYEQRKKTWELNNDGAYELSPEGKGGWKKEDMGKFTESEQAYIDAQMEIINQGNAKIKAERARDTQEQKEAEEQAQRELLKKYGTYEEKRKAIIDEYNEKIADARTQAEKDMLARERESSINALEIEYGETTSAISKLFTDMSDKSSTALWNIYNSGKEALKFITDGKWDAELGKKLGITEEDFNRIKNTPSELEAVENALEGVENKAKAASTAFGKISHAFEKLNTSGGDLTKMKEGIDDVIGGFNDLISSVRFFSDSIAKVGDAFGSETLTDISKGINVATDALSDTMSGVQAGFALGGPIGAAIGGAIGLVTSLASSLAKLHDEKIQKNIDNYQKKIDKLTEAYNDLSDEIDEVYSSDKMEKIRESNKLLQEQIAYIQKQISEEQRKNNTDKDAIESYKSKIKDLNKQIKENEEAAEDAIFGSSLQSAIENFTDAYADAWSSNEDRALSAKEVVKNIMKQMVKESVNAAVQSSGMMEQIRTKLTEFYRDGILSAWEQEYVYGMATRLQEQLDSQFGWADSLYGEDSTFSQSASSRGFQAMSQDVGEELNGRFTALQIAGESMNVNTTLLLDSVNNIMEVSRMNGILFSEMRNLAIMRNSYLEDMVKYSKNMYNEFSVMLDDIVTNTKRI